MTGVPCPSCGMTTSFALLIRGDWWNSLKANAVGTLLAAFCLALIPWSLFCAAWGRPIFVVSLERTLTKIVVAFVFLMLLRWGIVLGWSWWNGDWGVRPGITRPEPTPDSRRREDGHFLATLAARRPGAGGDLDRGVQSTAGAL